MASTTFARMLNRWAIIVRPALADAGYGASEMRPGSAANLVANGGFDADVSGWSASNGTGTVAIAHATDVRKFGAGSMQVTVAAGQQNGSRVQAFITCVAGRTYTLSAHVRASAAGAWNLRAVGLNGAMGIVSGAANVGTEWERIAVTFATGTTTSVRVDLNVSLNGLTGVTYVDQVIAAEGGAWDGACALAPLSDRERATAAQLEVAYDHRLFTDAAADIRRGDRVEVAPPLVVEGREPVYRVVAVRDPGHRGHHLEAMLAQELD